MEYPFKDLMPLDEATARDGYYKDWTHIDADTFHQISELVKFIREKGYGADTREAIAQALERVYYDAMKSGNADMELSMARKHFKDLASRLDASDQKVDSNTAQLAHTIIEARRKKGLEDLEPEVLEAIAGGEGTEFNLLSEPKPNSVDFKTLVRDAVEPEFTSFAKSNLSKTFGTRITGLGISGGREATVFSGADPKRVSYIFKIEPDTEYTVVGKRTNLFRVSTSTNFPENGGTINRNLLSGQTGQDELERYEFTSSESEEYLTVYIGYNDNFGENVYIYRGTEDEKVSINLDENIVEPEQTTFISRVDNSEDNLFDGTYVDFITTTGPDPSVNGYRAIYPSNGLAKSVLIEVDGGESYTIGLYGRKDERFTIGTYDTMPNPQYDERTIAIDFVGVGADSDHIIYETPNNAQYILINPSSTDQMPEQIVVFKGRRSLPAKPYALSNNIDVGVDGGYTRSGTGMLTDSVGNYIKNSTTDFTPADIANDRVADTYAIYDGHVAHAPDYVTKTHLWDEPTEDLPVNMYSYAPPTPLINRFNLEPITILIIGNIHGHETYATLPLVTFFEDLVKEWENNEVLELLRWNVKFDVIPIFNPWGLKNNIRVNGNGVDLNGNFHPEWEARDEVGSMYYSGPHVMSEYENIQFDNYLKENAHKYDFAVDVHHNGYFKDTGMATYTRSQNPEVERMLFGVANQFNGYFHKNFPRLATDNIHYSAIHTVHNKGAMYKMFEYYGIPGTLFETTPAHGATTPHEDVIQFATTHLGDIILNGVKHHEDFKRPPLTYS